MRYLLFLLLTVSAFGQGPPSREVFLRLLAFDQSIAMDSFAFDAAAPQPVAGTPAPIKDYLNHQYVKISITGNEVIFSKSGKFEDMKKAELQVSKVALPKSGNRFMLIFLPSPAEGQPIRIMPLDDSIKEFPLGSYRVINLSRYPVRLTLENKPYEFKPGSSSLIENPPVQENNHSAMNAYTFVDGKWGRIGVGLWPSPGRKRSIQMFWDNPKSKRTELNGARDISPPKPGADIVLEGAAAGAE